MPNRSWHTILITENILQKFRERNVVVLSPHFDDACFSLGEFLARLGQGNLVNIFTKGNYFARSRRWLRTAPSPAEVFAVRNAEDTAFAARCGLTRHDLRCEEPSLRGRRPRNLAYLEDDIRQVTEPILAILDKFAKSVPPGTRSMLLAPLGAGRHVNHRATAEMVMRFRKIIEINYDIHLYEDQP